MAKVKMRRWKWELQVDFCQHLFIILFVLIASFIWSIPLQYEAAFRNSDIFGISHKALHEIRVIIIYYQA